MARIRRDSRVSRGGQGLIELALVMPMIMLLALGTFDLTSAYRTDIGAAAAGREGLLQAIRQPKTAPNNIDVGAYIRGDGSRSVNWGQEQGPPNAPTDSPYAKCPDVVPPVAGTNCGDPAGCATLAPGQDACFAMGICTPTPSCPNSAISWNAGVPTSANQLVVVRVVERFVPATSAEQVVLGKNVYMTHDQLGFNIATN